MTNVGRERIIELMWDGAHVKSQQRLVVSDNLETMAKKKRVEPLNSKKTKNQSEHESSWNLR